MVTLFFYLIQAIRLHVAFRMALHGAYALYSALIWVIGSLSLLVLLLWYLDVSLISVVCCAPPTGDTDDWNMTFDSSNNRAISASPSNTPSVPNPRLSLSVGIQAYIDAGATAIGIGGFAAAASVAKTMPIGLGRFASVGIIASAAAAAMVGVAGVGTSMSRGSSTTPPRFSFTATTDSATGSGASTYGPPNSSAFTSSEFYACSEAPQRWSFTDWLQLPENPVDLQIVLVLCVIAFVFLSILCCVFLLIYSILLQEWIAERLISLFSQKWIPYVKKWVGTYLQTLKILRWVYLGALLWCLSFAFVILQYHLDWLLHLPK